MKIGTDGVLLGAWAGLSHQPDSILDVGAGTGVIALMMAQRSSAEWIDALEIESNAFEQCVENFENSPWGDRLFCYHAGLEEFITEMDDSYDLIVSNPPFFEPAPTVGEISPERQKARFSANLSFDTLIKAVDKLLNASGKFAVILPYENEEGFVSKANQHNLTVERKTRVRGHPQAPIKRSLLQFGRKSTPCKTNEIVIEKKRHQYTRAYIDLTKDFYLNM